MTAKKIIIKSISAFLIVSIILPTVLLSKSRQVEAVGAFVPVNDLAANKLQTAILKATGGSLALANKNWIEYLGEQILKMVAKRILAAITQATVNWINSGFHGSPLFLENPESFFKDIRKSVVKDIVNMIGYDDVRFPFGKQTALNVIASYKGQLETNAQYTLSKVINDPDLLREYRNNFNYGGWNGFLINTQYPQNNYLGFNMIIGESLGTQLSGTLQAPAERVQTALQQGMGFLSPQTCPTNPKYNNGTNEFLRPSFKPTTGPADESEDAYYARVTSERADWAQQNTCPGGLASTTPGSVAANQIFNALDSPRMMTLLDGALGNSFAAIFDALINKLLGDGLTALASTVNPGPEDDNWSYEGQTLGGGTNVSTPSAGALNINNPQHNVSLNVTTSTSKTISGGVGPYCIKISLTATCSNSLTYEMANVTISNNAGIATIKIDGKSISGETFVVIQDSSNPAKTTTINIEVSNPLELRTSPSNISINTNDTATARISGGVKPYSVETSPNQAIAIVGLAANILIVSGVSSGTTEVVIKDSSNPIKTFSVPITIRESSAVSVSQESILLNPGNNTNNKAERGISFNNPTITNSNPNVVNVEIVGTNLIFTSKNITGQTTIAARGPNHSIQNPQILEFNITVANSLTYQIQRHENDYRGDGINIDTNTQPLIQNRAYVAYISGGLAPYSVISYTSGIFTERPRFFSRTHEGRLYFVLKSGTAGSSGSINVGSAGGQILTISFTVN